MVEIQITIDAGDEYMKRKGFLLVCLVVACAMLWLSGCQGQAKVEDSIATADSGGPSPRITFEKLVCDFGDVSPNTLNKGQFKFTNTGDGVLEITKVGKCCSVNAKLADGKTEYAPGESGAVAVEWKSASKASVFAKQVTISSNDKANPEVKLSLQARIVPKIVWEPKSLRILLNEDNGGCSKLTIRSIDDRPFSITGFKSTGGCITADFDASVEATKFVLEPVVSFEKVGKYMKGRINISLTHPEGDVAIVLFDVLPEYTVKPQYIHLLNPEPNKPILRRIDLLSNYGKDFEIESVSSRDNTVAIRILKQKKIRNGYQLDVEMTVLGDEVKSRFTDEFSITLKGGEKLVIGCRGYSSKKG